MAARMEDKVVLITGAARGMGGIKAGPFNAPYNASKFGVAGLGKSFAMELAKHDIRVNIVHPGSAETELALGVMPAFGDISKGQESLVPMLNNWHEDDLIDVRAISNAVLYLLSDESTYTMGLSMAVDAGMSQY